MSNGKKKKILIIKLGAIGDSVFATIIASAIKSKHPDWQVDYLTHEGLFPLLEYDNEIDNLIPWIRGKNKIVQLFELGKTLRKRKYDIIFNLTITFRNFILTFLASPQNNVIKKEFGKSWVENFYLTAKSTIKDIEQPASLHIGLNPEALEKVKNEISNYPRPYIAIAPGGGTDFTRKGRLWNINNWSLLSKKLVTESGGTIFVLGSQKEFDYHKQLEADNVKILTGHLTLPESSAMFSLMDLVIAGDTGPIHIASAHNVKTLAILGSTSPDKIKPYGSNGYFIGPNSNCRYCWKKKCKYITENELYTPCMESITVYDVINKIKSKKLLEFSEL